MEDIVVRLRKIGEYAWGSSVVLAAREAADEITRLRQQGETRRHILAVYVHAHETGNSVPPHIDAQAREAIKEAK